MDQHRGQCQSGSQGSISQASVPCPLASEHTNSNCRETRDVLQTEIRKLDGNGPRPGERCETKWRIFAKINPNLRLEGPGTEKKFRFGSGWPVRVCPCGPCALAVWDCRTPHQLLLFLCQQTGKRFLSL